jgi:intracellular sulfur oxidation DsrE/DsrF family protein
VNGFHKQREVFDNDRRRRVLPRMAQQQGITMKKFLPYVFLALVVETSSALALPATAPAAAQAAASCAQHYNVVIGVGDKEKVTGALSNAFNLQKEFGAQCVNIEVVNFSSAVTQLTPTSPLATQVKDALKAGINIVACENSLNKFKLTIDDMFPGITAVPSGVGERRLDLPPALTPAAKPNEQQDTNDF